MLTVFHCILVASLNLNRHDTRSVSGMKVVMRGAICDCLYGVT
jgi:hypothetical protein